MSVKEFCLSDERRCLRYKYCYLEKDVKEFLEKIKQDFKDIFAYATPTKATNKCIVQFQAQIDKRAGGKFK